MKVTLLRLKPRAPFHLGERGVGVEETTDLAHSDTIFSALCWTWSLLYDQEALVRLLQRFAHGDPPFLISSSFPYAGDLRFLPKPSIPLGRSPEERRRFRKVRFVSSSIFTRLAEGEVPQEPILIQEGQIWLEKGELGLLPASTLDQSLLANYLRERSRLGEMEKPTEEEYSPHCRRLWWMAEKPQVAIDRLTSASEIYHFGDVTFAKGCGPYFLVRFLDEDEGLRERFFASLRLLGDEGLGGGRSAGRGLFDLVAPKEIDLPDAQGDRFVSLSLLSPKDASELTGLLGRDELAYGLIARRGWVYSAQARNLWRKRVTMFAEGSVLGGRADSYYGRLVKVLEQGAVVPHDVFRYGYAFPVGVK